MSTEDEEITFARASVLGSCVKKTCVCKKHEDDFIEYGHEDGIDMCLWTHVNVHI